MSHMQRRSQASRILEYFRVEELEVAEAILAAATRAVKERIPSVVAAPKVRKTRKPRSANGVSVDTAQAAQQQVEG